MRVFAEAAANGRAGPEGRVPRRGGGERQKKRFAPQMSAVARERTDTVGTRTSPSEPGTAPLGALPHLPHPSLPAPLLLPHLPILPQPLLPRTSDKPPTQAPRCARRRTCTPPRPLLLLLPRAGHATCACPPIWPSSCPASRGGRTASRGACAGPRGPRCPRRPRA